MVSYCVQRSKDGTTLQQLMLTRSFPLPLATRKRVFSATTDQISQSEQKSSDVLSTTSELRRQAEQLIRENSTAITHMKDSVLILMKVAI